MEFRNLQSGALAAVELVGEEVVLASAQDALDLIGEAWGRAVIVHERHVAPEFFRLGSRLAGEIFQKFTNYRVPFAVVGDFAKYPGAPLRDFIRESNATGRTVFAASVDEALDLLGAGI